ncbi:hypothetical protein CFE70_006142 [Pyrenophora teres f. teres 0-1]
MMQVGAGIFPATPLTPRRRFSHTTTMAQKRCLDDMLEFAPPMVQSATLPQIDRIVIVTGLGRVRARNHPMAGTRLVMRTAN